MLKFLILSSQLSFCVPLFLCSVSVSQSEMADPSSLCRTFDVIMHFSNLNALLISQHILKSYFVPSRNDEESFNKLLSPDPDPDHLRRGSSNEYTSSCVNISSQFEQ